MVYNVHQLINLCDLMRTYGSTCAHPSSVKIFETSDNPGLYGVVKSISQWLRGHPLLFKLLKCMTWFFLVLL